MKHFWIIFTCLLWPIFVVSCANDNQPEVNEDLSLADSYIASEPQVSLHILDSINNCEHGDNPYFALLYSQAKLRNHIKAENDSLIRIVLDYYCDCNDSTMKARAFLVAAQVYREIDEPELSLDYVRKASAVGKVKDNSILSQIYYEWGNLLRQTAITNGVLEKQEIALHYAKEGGDTAQIIAATREIGLNYLSQKDYAAALEMLNQAIALAQNVKSYGDLSSLYRYKSRVYSQMDNYREALRLIDMALQYNVHAVPGDSLSTLGCKGRLLIDAGQLDSAQYYIERGKDTVTIEGAKLYYASMSALCEKSGDFAAALEYERRYADAALEIARKMGQDKIATLDNRYNYMRLEAEHNQLRTKYHKWLVITLIASSIIAVGTQRLRHRTRVALQKQADAFNENLSQMQQNEKIAMAKQLMEREEIFARNLANKEMELEATKNMLTDLKKRLLHTNNAVNKIQAILKSANSPRKMLPELPNEEERREMVVAVNNSFDGFVDKLKQSYPALSDSDIYMCCLIKMGLDNLGLCVVLGTSDGTLRKRKYRLKKEKIDPEGRYSSLEEIIRQI